MKARTPWLGAAFASKYLFLAQGSRRSPRNLVLDDAVAKKPRRGPVVLRKHVKAGMVLAAEMLRLHALGVVQERAGVWGKRRPAPGLGVSSSR
jgi:hypothetical protein